MAQQTEVENQTGSTKSSNQVKSMGKNDEIGEKSDNKNEVQYKKYMETCSVCTTKDENLRSRNIEFTKIENLFKEKCKEMFENEKILKQQEEELTHKYNGFKKENEILKQKCSAKCNECFKKDNIFRELQKEYDVMKYSHHRVKEAYDTLKSQVKRLEGKVLRYSETTKFLEAKYKGKQLVLNQYIDEVAELKQKLAEKENNKLQSYHASSYILERISILHHMIIILKRIKRGLDHKIFKFHHYWRKVILSMMMKRWQRQYIWLINCLKTFM
ncbi:hypothetical protein Hanom_Chr07g00626421 [Helianthus anomalus]